MSQESKSGVGADTVVVIPVGPTCRLDFVADTIESVRFFAPKARIIIVDDSGAGRGVELERRYNVTVVAATAHGLFGSLYMNLSAGFDEALRQPFRILVRLDTDALIAGDDFESKAIDAFEADQRLGSLGSFRVGYDGIGLRDASWAKRQILIYFALRSWRTPRAALIVVRLLARARRNGYKFGESIMGGAVVYRYEAIDALKAAGLLGRAEITGTGLQEDHLFGLCLFSLGYRLGEFGNRHDDLPMGVAWRGLPASPEELIERRKSIIHSTKSFQSMNEEAIRREFRAARQSGDDASSLSSDTPG
jgi:hypothetical protein